MPDEPDVITLPDDAGPLRMRRMLRSTGAGPPSQGQGEIGKRRVKWRLSGDEGMTIQLRLKRAYEDPAEADGLRILVDRLWPRGLGRQEARIDHWAKEVAPSTELRRWFGHDPDKWPEFRRRYEAELRNNATEVKALRERIGTAAATLLFAAKDTGRNNAVVLRGFLASGD